MLFLAQAAAAADEAKPEAKPEAKAEDNTEYSNWITFGMGAPFISGNSQAFMAGQQMNKKSVFGGVESFHWEQNLGKSGLLELNGAGMYDEHNYGVDLKVSEPETGYISVGYEQFRTYYNNAGGYYPLGPVNWFDSAESSEAVDRGKAWFEAGLTMPDMPQVTFRYEHDFRNGEKDSTVWGDSNLTGTPPPYGTTRNFTPAYLDLDEKRDTFSLTVKHTLGKTDVTVGGSYQHLDTDNTRNIERRPGEPAADRYVTERDRLTEDLFSTHGMTETRFNDKVKVTVGGAFTTLNTDVDGSSRIYGNQFNTPNPTSAYNRQARDSGFYDVTGGGNVNQYVGNLNVMYTPSKDWAIVPSLRIQKDDVDGSAQYFPTTTGATAPFPFTTNALTLNEANRDLTEVTEALEVRYSGFKNWSLYARAELSEACEDRDESTTTTTTVQYGNDWSRLAQKYTAGANWFTLPRLNMGVQYYYKRSDNEWKDGGAKDTLNFQTHDLNYRLNWRPLSQLSLVTRYDFQYANADHQVDSQPEVESFNMTSQMISESVNWTPLDRLYLQLSGSYAWDGSVNVPVEGSSAFGATNVAPNLNNGYWVVTAMTGYALDEVTDLQLQYNFFRADNYENNAQWSQPYGTSAEEHSITATISRQMNKRTKVSLKYGYVTSDDNTSGNQNNYDAHLLYATLQYRF